MSAPWCIKSSMARSAAMFITSEGLVKSTVRPEPVFPIVLSLSKEGPAQGAELARRSVHSCFLRRAQDYRKNKLSTNGLVQSLRGTHRGFSLVELMAVLVVVLGLFFAAKYYKDRPADDP